jgi:hypothetical protein
MLVMKSTNQINSEAEHNEPPENIPRDSRIEQAKKIKEELHKKEESRKKRVIEERPRKSYHHDGPGGGYDGF